jgi:hypothetical protein
MNQYPVIVFIDRSILMMKLLQISCRIVLQIKYLNSERTEEDNDPYVCHRKYKNI